MFDKFLNARFRVNRTFAAALYYSCWAIIVYCFVMGALTTWGRASGQQEPVPSDGRVEDDAVTPPAAVIADR